MRQLTKEGRTAVTDIAGRYQLSTEAIEHMLNAVNNGQGSMAQFNCPELGGSGQWMRGGMTMVGDMFNHSLKSTVDSLCIELSTLLANTQVFPVSSSTGNNSQQWWPAGLGTPRSSGSQNNSRYAVFAKRLVVESGGKVSLYDTLDHQINGVSQQQGNDATLTFSSQHGTVSLNDLTKISGTQNVETPQTDAAQAPKKDVEADPSKSISESDESSVAADESPIATDDSSVATIQSIQTNPSHKSVEASNQESESEADEDNRQFQSRASETASDILSLIEKLAQLHSAGILTDEEFSAKKQELLARI